MKTEAIEEIGKASIHRFSLVLIGITWCFPLMILISSLGSAITLLHFLQVSTFSGL
jgi:hypothetical protein